MKRIIAVFSLLFCAAGFSLYAQELKSENDTDLILNQDLSSDQNVVFSEHLLGYGICFFGPEISYTYRYRHLQAGAEFLVCFGSNFFDGKAVMLTPKIDVGYNFLPDKYKFNFFIGGFAAALIILEENINPVFTAGPDLSFIFRLNEVLELSVTTYFPWLPYELIPLSYIVGPVFTCVNFEFRLPI